MLQLEELDDIFNSRSPVKTSIEKKKLDVDANANIVHVDTLGARRGLVWVQYLSCQIKELTGNLISKQ